MNIYWWRGWAQGKLASYGQSQGAYGSGCGPFCISMVVNILFGDPVRTNGTSVINYLERHGYKIRRLGKYRDIGIPPCMMQQAIKAIERNIKVKVHRRSTIEDLTNDLRSGRLSIICISWESTSAMLKKLLSGNGHKILVGHYLVFVGFDPIVGEYVFLDPGKTPDRGPFTRYGRVELQRYWIDQPNLFIPPGVMISASFPVKSAGS